jgi:hypothetical protein
MVQRPIINTKQERSFMKFWHTHKWSTVAIDTTNGFHTLDKDSGSPKTTANHIIKFQQCGCGQRQIDAADATERGRDFALNEHSDIALQRTIWEESGKITGYTGTSIVWVDPAFAPLGGFESYLTAMKNDPALVALLKEHSMVDDALGQFEVAIKLHINNSTQSS